MIDKGARALRVEDLVGTWRLRTWESIGDDSSIEHPMGDAPEGVLVYTPDGTMITTIGRAGRTPIAGGDLVAGPVEERLAAMGSFIAYSGAFSIDGEAVLHTVAMSLFPNWVGTTQRRHVALSPDASTLTLTSDPFVLGGRLSAHRLAWERVRG